MRTAEINRATKETDIKLKLGLDGGETSIGSGNGFFDHMLELFAGHSGYGLQLECIGDIQVDFHHSCEDIGIALGRAFDEALGDRAGINRYGWIILPMDEALIMVSADISGRGMLCFDAEMPAARVGEFRYRAGERILDSLLSGSRSDFAYPGAGRGEYTSYHRGYIQGLRSRFRHGYCHRSRQSRENTFH